MKLLSINVGKPQKFIWQEKEVMTSIFKKPTQGACHVNKTNLDGDQQSDLKVHGGIDKAVYAYSYDTYSWWQQELNQSNLEYGAFGENLTVDSLDETNIFVGDIFKVGTCILQVTQPRVPCFKLEIKFQDSKIIEKFINFRRCGVYFRVLKEGNIQTGDSLELTGSEKIKASVRELFQYYTNKSAISKTRAAEIAQIESLSPKWKERFQNIANSKE